MNKEMPLSVEWMPQNAYVRNSLDHLLPGERNQHNFVFVKQETEFFENALNSQSVQNTVVHLQVSSKEKAKEIKQESSHLDILVSFDLYLFICVCVCSYVIISNVQIIYLFLVLSGRLSKSISQKID